jgi:hypothetical protein
MPVTLSYDIATEDPNHRSYIRSMFERFGWQRLGGSVLRYSGRPIADGSYYDDWLNDITPSIMFLRSYVLLHNLHLKFLTIDAASTSFLDFTDQAMPVGHPPYTGAQLALVPPTNDQSSVKALRQFVDAATAAGAP